MKKLKLLIWSAAFIIGQVHLALAQRFDPSNSPNHSGFVPRNYHPADPGPADWPNPFYFLGPNVLGNYIMAFILLMAVMIAATGHCIFGLLLVAGIAGGIYCGAGNCGAGHF